MYEDAQIRNVGRQTLGFELPALPDQEFRIAIPELISDANGPILPWGFPSPEAEDALGVAVDEEAIEKHRRAAFFSFSGPVALPLNRRVIGGPLVNFAAHNIRVRLRGDTVVAMDNFGADLTFFDGLDR